jgi:hypothetical protein
MAGICFSFRAVCFFLIVHFIVIRAIGEKKPEN